MQETHNSPDGSVIRPLTDLRKVRPIKRHYLVDGVILKHDEMCIYGLPGTCKSATAASLITAISHEQPWFGRTVKGGATLTIACEGADGWSARMRAAQMVQGIDENHDAKYPQFHFKWPVNLLNATSKNTLIYSVKHWMRQENVEALALVVIDTVSRVIPGVDQNNAGALEAFNSACMEIKEALGQPAILSIHHSDKKGNNSRGSNALDGGLNAMVKVSRNKTKSKVTLKTDKDHRDGLPFEQLDLAVTMRDVQVWNEEINEWELQSAVCVSGDGADIKVAEEAEADQLISALDLSNVSCKDSGKLAADCQRLLDLLDEAGDEGLRHANLRKATTTQEDGKHWGEERFKRVIGVLEDKGLIAVTPVGTRGRLYTLVRADLEAEDTVS